MEYATSRPRVLGWLRSAAILDGDWGTSIAYVLGIGFALGGYASVWHLLMMLALTTLVAVNYMTICRLYPTGGGVYSSVHPRSPRRAWARSSSSHRSSRRSRAPRSTSTNCGSQVPNR